MVNVDGMFNNYYCWKYGKNMKIFLEQGSDSLKK